MSSAASHPRLRLVGTPDAPLMTTLENERRVRRNVAAENRASARNGALDPTDPRWVLAARTHAALQGSAICPERRARLMRTAAMLGIRPFDANIIVAIVQDQARRGEPLDDARPILSVVRRPPRSRAVLFAMLPWVAAILSAIAVAALLAAWLRGGAGGVTPP